jgi:hypothetical protein
VGGRPSGVGADRRYVEVEKMITVYEKKGKQEGKQEDVILLLEKKFGKLSAVKQRKIRQIESLEKLDSLLLAVLDAKSIQDLPF